MNRSRPSVVLAVFVFLGQASCNEKLEVLHSPTTPGGPGVAAPLVGLAVCDVPVPPEVVDHPTSIVGTGTIQSCTDQALAAAVALGGVIVFRCGSQPATLNVSSEKLVVRDTVIDGGGLVTLSGGDKTRIFHLRGADPPAGPRFTIQNLTIERGLAPVTPNDDAQSSGGAILQEGGTLVVHNSSFRHNATAPQALAAVGGAIGGRGDTTIVGSVFENNSAGNGGALGLSERNLTIVNSRLEGNAALTQGMSMNGGRGGAVSVITGSSNLSVCGSEMSGNSAMILGGAMFLSMIAGGTATVDRSTFDKNQCNDPSDPNAPNVPSDAGVARPSGRVGAIYAQGVALKVTSSTISNNQSVALAALFVIGFKDRQVPGSVDLVNVTIANNRSYPRMPITNTGVGGGLWIDEITQGRVLNCTIVGNEAQFGAGIVGFSSLTIDNSIVSNSGHNVFNPINCIELQVPGATSRGSHDLQWPADNGSGPDLPCAPGTTFADPMLDDLFRDPATSTSTMAPKVGSPALAQGQSCPPTDQRGKPRKTPCTLGAYESDL